MKEIDRTGAPESALKSSKCAGLFSGFVVDAAVLERKHSATRMRSAVAGPKGVRARIELDDVDQIAAVLRRIRVAGGVNTPRRPDA
jgi:hypothetical protein